jgi:hypothetical protein
VAPVHMAGAVVLDVPGHLSLGAAHPSGRLRAGALAAALPSEAPRLVVEEATVWRQATLPRRRGGCAGGERP